MTFICYSKCSTCKKAETWLIQHNFSFKKRAIKDENPSSKELENYWKMSGLPLKKFFNTSGLVYRELNLKEKLKDMSNEEQLQLLSTDGMLIKRPLLITDKKVLVGFNEKKWETELLQSV